jgi:hypothetical protein
MFGRIIVASFLCLSTGVSARANSQEHSDAVLDACRHILSPAMATAHPEFERQIFSRCIELQQKVQWQLDPNDYN